MKKILLPKRIGRGWAALQDQSSDKKSGCNLSILTGSSGLFRTICSGINYQKSYDA
jgi:hypothetical protein